MEKEVKENSSSNSTVLSKIKEGREEEKEERDRKFNELINSLNFDFLAQRQAYERELVKGSEGLQEETCSCREGKMTAQRY